MRRPDGMWVCRWIAWSLRSLRVTKNGARWPPNSHPVRRPQATDDDAAAVTHIPHHRFADRIAAVADDGALRHLHPLAFDRHPIAALADIIFGAMAIGDVAAGHAVGRHHALEPGADIGRHVFVLPVIEGQSRARQCGQASEQGDLRELSHAILHGTDVLSSWRAARGAHESSD